MTVVIISDRPEFRRTVRTALENLCQDRDMDCFSQPEWELRDLTETKAGTWILADPLLPVLPEGTVREDRVFVLSRRIHEHPGEWNSTWEALSQDAFLLRLHERAASEEQDQSIATTVLQEGNGCRVRQIRMPARRALIERVRSDILASVRTVRVLARDQEPLFGAALGEALANAVWHGSLELSSSPKHVDEESRSALADQRESEPRFRCRAVHITEVISQAGVWVTIRDEGRGFHVRGVLSRDNPADLQRRGGRGLVIMKAFCDDVFFNPAGNEVSLVARGMNERPEDCAWPSAPRACAGGAADTLRIH